MSQHPAQGAPDYFALFQSMFSPQPAAAAAAPMFPMLDAKELERKIAELETVLAWLKATAGVMEVSLQTMKYQHSLLSGLAATPPAAGAAPAPDMEELARMAGSMNPALWALNLMQPAAAKPPAARKTTRKPAAKKR